MKLIEGSRRFLLSFELKVWSDAGLGCPQPGMAYIQVPQDGYLIILRANNQLYNYHGGGRGDNPPFLCQNLGKSKGLRLRCPAWATTNHADD
jgi:hypothetical protein